MASRFHMNSRSRFHRQRRRPQKQEEGSRVSQRMFPSCQQADTCSLEGGRHTCSVVMRVSRPATDKSAIPSVQVIRVTQIEPRQAVQCTQVQLTPILHSDPRGVAWNVRSVPASTLSRVSLPSHSQFRKQHLFLVKNTCVSCTTTSDSRNTTFPGS